MQTQFVKHPTVDHLCIFQLGNIHQNRLSSLRRQTSCCDTCINSGIKRMRQKSESRIKQRGRMRRLHAKSPEQTVGTWTKIRNSPWWWWSWSLCTVKQRLIYTSKMHEAMHDSCLQTQGRTFRQHKCLVGSSPRNISLNVCTWLQVYLFNLNLLSTLSLYFLNPPVSYCSLSSLEIA